MKEIKKITCVVEEIVNHEFVKNQLQQANISEEGIKIFSNAVEFFFQSIMPDKKLSTEALLITSIFLLADMEIVSTIKQTINEVKNTTQTSLSD